LRISEKTDYRETIITGRNVLDLEKIPRGRIVRRGIWDHVDFVLALTDCIDLTKIATFKFRRKQGRMRPKFNTGIVHEDTDPIAGPKDRMEIPKSKGGNRMAIRGFDDSRLLQASERLNVEGGQRKLSLHVLFKVSQCPFKKFPLAIKN
jgi:hypothetical protein